MFNPKTKSACNIVLRNSVRVADDAEVEIKLFEFLKFLDNGEFERSYRLQAMAYDYSNDCRCHLLSEEDMPFWMHDPAAWVNQRMNAIYPFYRKLAEKNKPAA